MFQSQMVSLEHPPQLQIKGEFIFYEEREVAYLKQMIRQGSFFLIDSGIELPLTQEILDFDQKYFWYMLNQKIVRQLEILDPSVGVQILEAMPDLPEKTYVAIFGRLSLHKIKKIIMNNQFYSHIIKKLQRFAGCKKQTLQQNEQLPSFADLYDLDQPHKRLLYILDNVKCTLPLHEVLYLIAYQVILSIVNQPNFLESLNQSNKQIKSEYREDKQKVYCSFLNNALKMIQTLSSMTRVPQELLAEHKMKNERRLIHLILNDSFIEFITVNFEHFLDFDANKLTRLLSIISSQKEQKFWSEIIAKKYAKQNKSFVKKHLLPTISTQKSEDKAKLHYEETTNENLFIQLMTHNFYEIGQPEWQNSQGIISDIINNSASAAKFCLAKLFSQLSSHFTTVSVIELVVMFIKQVCAPPQFDRSQIQFFLIQFLGNINVAVSEQYSKFESKIRNKTDLKENLILIVSLLKVYTLILELKLVNILCGLDIARAISQLMEMTRDKKGLIEGSRRAFLKTKSIYLLQTHLLQNFGKKKEKIKLTSRTKPLHKTRHQMEQLFVFLKRID